jgi:uncharacterized protein YjbI with pentapeptide repeats
MKFQIKNRWTGAVQYECELSAEVAGMSYGLQLGFAVKHALASGSNLSGSNLSGSNLSGSNLRGSNLSGSNLSGSNLSGSNLRGSNLSGSDLRGSNLRGSNLSGSDLRDSDLSGSNLSGSNLRGSNLSGSDLRDSDLSGSNLSGSTTENWLDRAKTDIFAVLESAPNEAPGVLSALNAGEVDGSTYSTAGCSCLVGTIAKLRGCDIGLLPPSIAPNSSRPAEQYFMTIRPGHLPGFSMHARLAAEWVREWIAGNGDKIVSAAA